MRTVFITGYIRPICLAPEEIAIKNITGYIPSVAGWGTTKQNQRMYIIYISRRWQHINEPAHERDSIKCMNKQNSSQS